MSDAHSSRTPLDDPGRRHEPAPSSRPTLSTALERTVERFAGMILAVGRRHGLGEADVDEVMQEVRIRLWRNRGDTDVLEGLGASYVHRTASSAAVDVLRRRRARRTGIDATDPISPELTRGHGDPAEEVEQRELGRRVFAAVERITPSRRPVVRMHLLGYGRREIADLLGITEGAVRNLMSRGMGELRELLAKEGMGPGGEG